MILYLPLADSELTANGVLIHFTELFLVLVACHISTEKTLSFLNEV